MFWKNRNYWSARSVVVLSLLSSLIRTAPVQASSMVYRVAPEGSFSHTCGTDWSSPCDLEFALNGLASSGDELWVKAGTYKPGDYRTSTFTLRDGVAVYGGFAGTETLREQRDPSVNVTMLSGDLSGNDNNNIAHDEPTRADNVFHVVASGDDSSATILDGFTISGGNANLNVYGDPATRGGGMWSGDGSPTLTNLVFTRNSAIDAGGGIFITNGSPALTDTTFTNNSAEGGGGLVNHQSNSVLTRVTFTNNEATYMGGGAANVSGSQATYTDVTFVYNTSYELGGGMGNVDSTVTVSNSTYYGNYAPKGGGIYNRDSHPNITNTTFVDNLAGSTEGSAIGNERSNPVLAHVTITSIHAGYDAIKNVSSHPLIHNSIIWGDVYPPATGMIAINDDPDSSSTVRDSVIRDGYPDGTNIITADPLLGPLGNYGGNTKNLMLFAGSPAIDQANASYCPSKDQRGVVRPQGMGCDIGAHEFEPTSVIHYVNWDVTGANDGTSWANAYTDLQSAILGASNGDEIWVAAGTYKPTSTTNRTISFILKNGVAVYGGFAGTETTRDQRNYETNFTILSGDVGAMGNNSDNSYHVVVGSNTNTSAILDGFVITAGNANASVLVDTDKGGGMYSFIGSPSVRNVIFSENYARLGGGMHNLGEFNSPPRGSSPVLTNVIFKNNIAIEGGGMRNWHYSSPTLIDVIFDSNSVTRAGGGMGNGYYSSPSLTNVTFLNNVVTDQNGLGAGGGISNWMGNNPTLTNVTFTNNSAVFGGGMWNYDSDPVLANVTLDNNSAFTSGGGIYNESTSNATVQNTILWENTAPTGAQIHNVNTGTAVVSDSVVQDGFAGGTNIITTDPLLGSLGDYGGFTETIPLQTGSAAIDTGNDANCPDTDQRGVIRPQGSHCDIGAYEFQPTSVIHYVKWDATGTNDGSSWENAYTDLQFALAAASSGEEIWIAAGTYKPTSGTDRTISFPLKNEVAIYGGFAGTETLLSERNAAVNLTILSGDIGMHGNISDNSNHVVTSSFVDNTALLDGFTITAGNASRGGGMYNEGGSPSLTNLLFSGNIASFSGGGMYNEGGSPLLTDVNFNGNTAISGNGGGMYNFDARPSLTNVAFSGNTASTWGGGMYNNGGASPSLVDVAFSDNIAYAGGGMYNSGSLLLVNVTFSLNTADHGGGMYNDGSLSLMNVTFDGNTALIDGGGMYNHYTTNALLTNVIFSDNTADYGGGMINLGGASLTNVTFSSNTANLSGGGMSNNGGASPSLTNVTFSGNIASDQGGGMYNTGGPSLTNVTFSENTAEFGGAMFNDSGSSSLMNATISGNTAYEEGGGIYSKRNSNSIVRNTILWGNVAPTGGQIHNDNTSVSNVSDSMVEGGFADGTNIITTDPLLGAFDNYSGFTETLPLQIGSSAIDAGNDTNCPATDQRGVTRPQGSHCDIGAYEYKDGDSLINVDIGNAAPISYPAVPHETQRQSYPGVNGGPVKITHTNNLSIMAAERVIYKVNGINTSFSELMGLPASQLDNTYWLPWYNNVDLDTQLRFANVTDQPATVTVTIGGVPQTPINLAAGESTRKSFPGINAGPVQIESTQNIVAAERVIYKINGVNTSFSEMMALPNKQLDTTYWLPWYNNVDLDTQLRIANVTDQPASITVTIGGVPMEPFNLPAGESMRVSYPAVNAGPVKIESTQKIVAAERVIYKFNGINTSFSEMMALPNNKLNATYWLPWYNNVDLDTQLRFGNVSDSQQATVRVYIGNSEVSGCIPSPAMPYPYILQPGESVRVNCPSVNSGPVKIKSDIPIVAAERVIYKINGTPTSFSEMMGLPNGLLDATYWFPWYNNVDLDTQLRFGAP
jgi:predicted outer membrane repeat protein